MCWLDSERAAIKIIYRFGWKIRFLRSTRTYQIRRENDDEDDDNNDGISEFHFSCMQHGIIPVKGLGLPIEFKLRKATNFYLIKYHLTYQINHLATIYGIVSVRARAVA